MALGVAMFGAGWLTGRHPSRTPSPPPAQVSRSPELPTLVHDASSHPAGVTPRGEPPVKWSRLEAADYPGFIARLREAGCPELTIRDLVLTDLGRNYGEQIRQLGLATGADPTAGKAAAVRLLAERDGIAWQLLGLDYEAELRTIWPEEFGDAAAGSFAHLDPVQRWQARQIEQEFLEAERVLQNQAVALGERFEEAVADLRTRRAERLRFILPQRVGIP